MKFRYHLPEFQTQPQKNNSYLPSLIFIVFSADPKDGDYRLQNVFARRLPQVMKTKLDLISHFNTSFILPLDRSTGSAAYIESSSDSPFFTPKFVEQFERFDYLVEGALSLDNNLLIIKLFSRQEEKVLFERRYQGAKEEFHTFINSFLVDLLNYFKINPDKNEMDKMLNEPTTKPKSFESLLEALDQDPINAVDSIDKEKFIEHLLNAVKEDPKNSILPSYVTGYINKLTRGGKSEKALEILDKLAKLQPDSKAVVELQIKAQLNRHNNEKALEILGEKLKLNTELFELPYLFAREIIQTDKAGEAIPFFELALAYNPENPDLYDSYGFYYMTTGKLGDALEQFKKGIELSPYRETTLLNTAQAYTESGRYEEAKAIYERLLTLYSDSSESISSYAIFHALTKNFREAAKFMKGALDVSPENPQINLIAAMLFDHIRDRNNAELYAKTAIDLSSDKYLKDEAQALYSRIYAGITEEEQRDNREKFLQAVILLRKNEIEKALDIIDRVVEVEPQFWRAWFLKGVTCRISNNLDSALEAFDHVDELYPEQAYLRHEIAKCLMAQEKFSEAFPLLRYAFKSHPEDPEIMANMGLNYFYLGRLNEAETLLKQVQKTDPDNKNIEAYLTEIEKIKKKKQSSRGNGDTKD
jgi:tetratricopeptide (TPR) repeat protein